MTIIVNHTCLADGTRQRGSYLDCGPCRDALIKSFGEPVGEENSTERSQVSPASGEQESDPDDPVTRCAYCGFPHHESRCGFCRYDNEHWD